MFKQSYQYILRTTKGSETLVENGPQWHFFKLFFALIFKGWGCHVNNTIWDAF